MSKALMTGKEQIATRTTSGIVKLSDVSDSSQGVDSGYAVTPKAIAEQVTSRSDYKKCYTWRNLKLTFVNSNATFDASYIIGTTNNVVGFCIFPYNSISNGKAISENGILTIKTSDTNINGDYYVSIFVNF